MSQDRTLYEIVGEAQAISKTLPRVAWYGFGSYFRRQSVFSDIDILVVCRTPAEALLIRTHTVDLCARWPLHLIIMTEDEEAETGFVASEKCKLLWGASSPSVA
jgi:hypothetical protein